jgi:phage terminase small subunit
MGVPKRLTDQQRRFSELYVYNEGRMTPYECAKEAGYAEESARVRASELRNPKLARLREEALKKGSFSSAVNAEVSRGKAAGLYIEQKIIKTGKLEDMSEQELETRMKEIVDQYSPILDAKPIEQLKKEVKASSTPLLKKLPDTTYEEKSNVEEKEQNENGDYQKVIDNIAH